MVQAGNGEDPVRIDESNGVFADTIPTTLDGGRRKRQAGRRFRSRDADRRQRDDMLFGGNGNEMLLGGNGNDSIDGNRGNDVASLGDGDDTFVWDPGDGSDTVEGQNGTDTMLFNGANVAEKIDLSANGHRLRFHRDVAQHHDGHSTASSAVDVNALGGADTVTVNDLTGTDVDRGQRRPRRRSAAATGDGAADDVIVNGTDGDDTDQRHGDAGGVKVSGLVPTSRLFTPRSRTTGSTSTRSPATTP